MDMTKVRPVSDQVIVKVAARDEVRGGILVPEAAREKKLEGEVMAVGPGRFNAKGILIETTVKVGDRILFAPWVGTAVGAGHRTAQDGEYIVLPEEHVIAVIEP